MIVVFFHFVFRSEIHAVVVPACTVVGRHRGFISASNGLLDFPIRVSSNLWISMLSVYGLWIYTGVHCSIHS